MSQKPAPSLLVSSENSPPQAVYIIWHENMADWHVSAVGSEGGEEVGVRALPGRADQTPNLL